MPLLPPPDSDVSIIYHADCHDGYGAAYAAWKRYGDSALYTANAHGSPYVQEAIQGKNVILIDFSFKKEILDEIQSLSKSLTILDHHASAKDAIESMPSSQFDNNHSGAYLAWRYFHPDTPVPKLIEYIEDDDLYRFALPNSRIIREYLFVQPYDFRMWDSVRSRLEEKNGMHEIIASGLLYREHAVAIIQQISQKAELVSFEGYDVYAVAAPRLFDSEIGHVLAERKPPFALLFKFEPQTLRVSLRGDGSVDVSAIATKYGGGGHHDAAGFNLPHGSPYPFKII